MACAAAAKAWWGLRWQNFGDRALNCPRVRLNSSVDSPVQPPRAKFFTSLPTQIISLFPTVPPHRGAYHDRHLRGMGCSGRGSVGRATRSQGGAFRLRERSNGARTNGACCGRQNRVVLAPRCWCQVGGGFTSPTGLKQNLQSADDGDKTNSSPGSAAYTAKAIAQGRPGVPVDPWWTNPCAFFTAYGAAGATGTRLSLRPLICWAGISRITRQTVSRDRGVMSGIYPRRPGLRRDDRTALTPDSIP